MHKVCCKHQIKRKKGCMHTTLLKTFILHKKVHILCNTSYELNKNVSKTVKNRTEIVVQTPFLFNS